ncbi:MAG TPA: hypothetical protein GX689_04975 [Lentisphaerae bacterium]|nr:hypothetical protein [Lentisphaerota bacterium]
MSFLYHFRVATILRVQRAHDKEKLHAKKRSVSPAKICGESVAGSDFGLGAGDKAQAFDQKC